MLFWVYSHIRSATFSHLHSRSWMNWRLTDLKGGVELEQAKYLSGKESTI